MWETSCVRWLSIGDAREHPLAGRVAGLVAVLMMVGVACSGGEATVATTSPGGSAPSTALEPTTAGPTNSSSTTVPPPEGATIELGTGEMGSYLVDGEGNTLYLFLDDGQGSSSCYGACAATWPPLTGEVTAGAGVEAALFGTEPRSDGTDQITYVGWPLYYFSGDGSSGDVNGQGRDSAWFVVDVEGNPIGQAG